MRLEEAQRAPRLSTWSPDTVTLFERAVLDNSKSGSIQIRPGTTVAEAVRLKTPGLSDAHRASLRVSLYGVEKSDLIEFENWERVRLKPGAFVVIDAPPMGGGALRSLLSIVISIAALAFAPYLAGVIGLTGLIGATAANAIVAGALAVAGNYLLNALIPVRSGLSSDESSPTYSIQGWKNTVQPGAPIPLVVGSHRFAPPFIVPPYSRVRDGKQYLYAVFIWGPGKVRLEDIKIGERELEDFKFVRVEHHNVDGQPETWPFTIVRDTQIQTNYDIELLYNEDGAEEGDDAIRAEPTSLFTAPDSTGWSLDIYFPQGLVHYDKEGKTKYSWVTFQIRERPVTALGDDEPWVVIEEEYNVADKSLSPFWVTYERELPARGRYEIDVLRTSLDLNDSKNQGRTTVTGFRSVRPEYPINFPAPENLAMTAVEVRATNQLQGTLDEFNAVVSTLIDSWNPAGETWVSNQVTSNPADWYRYALSSPFRARPIGDGRMLIGEITDWHEQCTLNGYRIDRVYDVETATWEALLDVTHAGFAAPRMSSGRWGVSYDGRKNTVQSEPITPHNSWGFEGSRDYKDLPDAFRVKFKDRTDDFNDRERIVPRPGITDGDGNVLCEAFVGTPQVLEEMEPVGLTDPAQAYLYGMRRWFEIFLRANSYVANQDWESLLLQHGSMALLSHDILHRANRSGRVQGVNGNVVILDESVTMEAGKSYGVKFRRVTAGDDGLPRVLTRTVAVTPDETKALSLVGSGDLPEEDDIFMFGEVERLVVEGVVQSIERLEKAGARITFVDYAERIFDLMDEVVVPAWSSRVGAPVGESSTVPDAPIIKKIVSTKDVYKDGESVTDSPRRILVYARSAATGPKAKTFEIRHRRNNESDWRTPTIIGSADARSISIDEIYNKGNDIYVQVRGVSKAGNAGPWGVIREHTVGAGDPAGPIVTSFDVERLEDGTFRYSWGSANEDADRAKLRIGPTSANDYDDLTPLHKGFLTSSPYEVQRPKAVGAYKAGIRLTDEDGNQGPPSITLFDIPAEDLPQPPIQLLPAVSGSNVSISARADPADEHTWQMVWRRGSVFATATQFDIQRCDPGDTRAGLDTGVPSGTHRYWVASKNSEGAFCASPAYVDVTV